MHFDDFLRISSYMEENKGELLHIRICLQVSGSTIK